MTARTVAVIGAGFSGAILAVNLLRATSPCTRIILLERGRQFGLGQAYATGNASHLLNVPAGRMSAFTRDPAHFLNWLRQRGENAAADSFVPRRLYGAYVQELLAQAECAAGARLQLVSGAVTRLIDGWPLEIQLDDGRRLAADAAVLALGNFPPQPVLPGHGWQGSPSYRGNPWAPDLAAGLDPEAPVVLIGTGLTMIDTVLTLLDHGHRGPITALSRRGLSPNRHASRGHAPPALPLPDYPPQALGLLCCLRADAAACVAAGGVWQQAMDRFRPFIAAAWRSAPLVERTRFLRHLRRWWEVHRHRIAGPVADRIDAARAGGQLRITAGRIQAVGVCGDGLEVRFIPRAGGPVQCIEAARVINCTGPTQDYTRIDDPLVQGLLADGLVHPDILGLGLDTADNGALIGRDGLASATLFGVGPVTRGASWEITAVPDIRGQVEDLAVTLADALAYSSDGPIDFIRSNTRLRTAGSLIR